MQEFQVRFRTIVGEQIFINSRSTFIKLPRRKRVPEDRKWVLAAKNGTPGLVSKISQIFKRQLTRQEIVAVGRLTHSDPNFVGGTFASFELEELLQGPLKQLSPRDLFILTRIRDRYPTAGGLPMAVTSLLDFVAHTKPELKQQVRISSKDLLLILRIAILTDGQLSTSTQGVHDTGLYLSGAFGRLGQGTALLETLAKLCAIGRKETYALIKFGIPAMRGVDGDVLSERSIDTMRTLYQAGGLAAILTYGVIGAVERHQDEGCDLGRVLARVCTICRDTQNYRSEIACRVFLAAQKAVRPDLSPDQVLSKIYTIMRPIERRVGRPRSRRRWVQPD